MLCRNLANMPDLEISTQSHVLWTKIVTRIIFLMEIYNRLENDLYRICVALRHEDEINENVGKREDDSAKCSCRRHNKKEKIKFLQMTFVGCLLYRLSP